MIALRRAQPADVEAMSRVLISSITELCYEDHKGNSEAIAAWTANKTTQSVARWVADPALVMLVAEHQGEIAAVGALTAPDEIGLNYVAPAHRFMGVSRAMLAGLEALMRESGTSTGRLHSSATARRFYRSAGWIEVDGPLSGRLVAGYPMRKQLAPGP
jgi:GNAT superfamily N-acetyltransferase